jgi:hypothetical protein
MKSALALFLLAGAAALISGCITGGSGGIPASTVGTEKVVGPYTIVNGKIVTPARIETTYACNLDTLKTYLDTVPAESLGFELSGNSIKFLDFHSDTLSSGAIAQLTIMATRVGSGSGLEGAWNYREFKSEIVSGAPTAEDLDTLAKTDAVINKSLVDATFQVRFSN